MKNDTKTYNKLRNQVEKMQLNKSSMKIINADKYLHFMITNYMKYHINYNNVSELVYHSWTLYESNYISMNELFATVEILKPEKISVDIPSLGKTAVLDRKEFYELFTEQFKEGEI